MLDGWVAMKTKQESHLSPWVVAKWEEAPQYHPLWRTLSCVFIVVSTFWLRSRRCPSRTQSHAFDFDSVWEPTGINHFEKKAFYKTTCVALDAGHHCIAVHFLVPPKVNFPLFGFPKQSQYFCHLRRGSLLIDGYSSIAFLL